MRAQKVYIRTEEFKMLLGIPEDVAILSIERNPDSLTFIVTLEGGKCLETFTGSHLLTEPLDIFNKRSS